MTKRFKWWQPIAVTVKQSKRMNHLNKNNRLSTACQMFFGFLSMQNDGSDSNSLTCAQCSSVSEAQQKRRKLQTAECSPKHISHICSTIALWWIVFGALVSLIQQRLIIFNLVQHVLNTLQMERLEKEGPHPVLDAYRLQQVRCSMTMPPTHL